MEKYHFPRDGGYYFRPKEKCLFDERHYADDFNTGSPTQGDTPSSFALG